MNCVLVGCGSAARLLHLPALGQLPEVRLVAVIDPDPANLEGLSLDTPVYPELSQFDGSAEAVIIASPPAHHRQATQEAFSRGWHVYLEKPMATSVAEAEALVETQGRSGRIGMVGFNLRFRPALIQGRARLGELGPLRGGVGYLGNTPACGWRCHPSQGGGALYDLACHHLDLVTWLTGQPLAEGRATFSSHRAEQDTLSLWLRLQGGFEFNGFYGYGAIFDERLEVYGERGGFQWRRNLPWPRPLGTPANRRQGLLSGLQVLREALLQLKAPPELSYREALKHFFDSIREGKEPEPSFARGLEIQGWLEQLSST